MKYKDKSLRGNKAKIRSATRTKAIDARIERASEDYQTAYAALVSLGPALKQAEWQQHLNVLKPGDARGRPNSLFGDEERQKGGGGRKKARLDPEEAARWVALRAEGKMPMSWIWLSQGADGEEGDIVDNESDITCRMGEERARGMRYGEEVDLGEEEMRRVPDFLDRVGSAGGRGDHGRPVGLVQLQWADVEGFLELARAEYASMTPDDGEEEEDADEEVPDSGWLSE
ncbi:hypothetical protein B0H13DRAFT_2308980 [Mycena leptocephala]|nr:hypothetical protein B0H13DRAFT_2308980 [Mycena leptocephala]